MRRVRPKTLISLTAAAFVAGATTCTPGALAARTLSGAGSGLVAPLEVEWAQAFQAIYGITVNFTAAGSQTGISDVSARTVDFAAADEPMTSAQVSACHTCYQIPWALSAIAIGYHVGGVGSKLRVTGKVLAEIYLGQITRWNDQQIKALNPGVHLPSLKITPIYATGSGDTYAFTNYLSQVDASWRSRVGTGTTVGFPAGAPANGNSGVTALLESTNGSIAYVGAAYLIAHRLPAAAVQNSAGNFEYPNLSNIESAARTIKRLSKNALQIVDPPSSARNAYPISTFVYAIVPAKASQRKLLKDWLLYALGAGQAFGPGLDFPPIPTIVLNAATTAVKRFGGR